MTITRIPPWGGPTTGGLKATIDGIEGDNPAVLFIGSVVVDKASIPTQWDKNGVASGELRERDLYKDSLGDLLLAAGIIGAAGLRH